MFSCSVASRREHCRSPMKESMGDKGCAVHPTILINLSSHHSEVSRCCVLSLGPIIPLRRSFQMNAKVNLLCTARKHARSSTVCARPPQSRSRVPSSTRRATSRAPSHHERETRYKCSRNPLLASFVRRPAAWDVASYQRPLDCDLQGKRGIIYLFMLRRICKIVPCL